MPLVVRQHGSPSSSPGRDDNVAHTKGKKGCQLRIVINMPKPRITFYNPIFYDLHSYVLPSILHSPPGVHWVTSLPSSITLLFSFFTFLACSLSTSACHLCRFTPLWPILSFLNYVSLALMLPILSSCMMCSSWVRTAFGYIVTSTVP